MHCENEITTGPILGFSFLQALKAQRDEAVLAREDAERRLRAAEAATARAEAQLEHVLQDQDHGRKAFSNEFVR